MKLKHKKHEFGTMFCARFGKKSVFRITNWYETLEEARASLRSDFESGIKEAERRGLKPEGFSVTDVTEPFRVWHSDGRLKFECVLLAN